MKNLIREYRFVKTKRFGNLWNYIHGFSLETRNNSKITKQNFKNFFSDRDYRKGHPYNGAFSGIIDNKLYLPYLLHNYKEYIPVYYFYKDQSGFLSLEDNQNYSRTKRYGINEFFDLLDRKGKLVLKHCYSSLGVGFMLISSENNQYKINGEQIRKEALANKVNGLDEYIVTDFVEQHSYSSSICSTSLNTLRLLCVWDYEKRTFFVARAFHRFGCNGNVVDNLGSGNGILVYVNPETGILSSAGIINMKGQGEVLSENIKHPDHNLTLGGIQIPNYTEIVSKVIEICNSISFLRYVGIDVAITEDGFKIIEMNSLPSVEAVQQFEGFMVDPRIRKVLKK